MGLGSFKDKGSGGLCRMSVPSTRADIVEINDRGIDPCGDGKQQGWDDLREARVARGEEAR